MEAGDKPKADGPHHGFVEMTIAEFLGLTPYEAAIVEVRALIGQGIRRARDASGKSRATIARAMGSTQGRLTLCEAGSPKVTIELMLRALYAAGSSLTEIGFPGPPGEADERERERSKAARGRAIARSRGAKARAKTG